MYVYLSLHHTQNTKKNEIVSNFESTYGLASLPYREVESLPVLGTERCHALLHVIKDNNNGGNKQKRTASPVN
jgi:hypothetical protein